MKRYYKGVCSSKGGYGKIVIQVSQYKTMFSSLDVNSDTTQLL